MEIQPDLPLALGKGEFWGINMSKRSSDKVAVYATSRYSVKVAILSCLFQTFFF